MTTDYTHLRNGNESPRAPQPVDVFHPHDTHLEEVILGACLAESAAMPLVADKLRPDLFYEDPHREICQALQSLYRSGKPVDIITVKEELAARGKLEMAGGPYNLTRLCSCVASSAHLEEHVMILQQKFIRRETILGLHRLLPLSADESVDIADTLAELHHLVDYLEGECGYADHLRDMDRLMGDTLAQMELRITNNQNGITGIPTGLTDLDRITAGWQRGDLNIIAARPSVGKTAFALHLARSAAGAGHHVVVYSLEMQGERLGDRWLLAVAPDIHPAHLRGGQMDANEQQQARDAAAELSRLSIHVDDNPSTGIERVRASARLLQSKGKCDMVIIDYLQLCEMKSDQKNRNREQEVAETSRKAKLLAKELNIPVLLLCQLNRDCEARGGHRPELRDLRESGAIEQDADVVMLLYRPALYGLPTDKVSKYPADGLGVVIIAKQRNGETGEVYFAHNPSLTKMGDYVPPLEWLRQHAR